MAISNLTLMIHIGSLCMLLCCIRQLLTSAINAKKRKEDASQEEVKSGNFVFSNGDRYDGEYRQLPGGTMVRSGYGVHLSSNSTMYMGNWDNDQMSGNGRIQFSSGAVYDGEFVNNCFNGKGRYTWPNGSHFDGTFINNRLFSLGEFTDTDGQTWVGGFFENTAPGLRYKLQM